MLLVVRCVERQLLLGSHDVGVVLELGNEVRAVGEEHAAKDEAECGSDDG